MPRFDDKLLAISEGFFRSFNPSLLKSFLFKMDNFSYFFIKLKAKSSSSFELLVSSAISTSHFKNFSLSFSLCFYNFDSSHLQLILLLFRLVILKAVIFYLNNHKNINLSTQDHQLQNFLSYKNYRFV